MEYLDVGGDGANMWPPLEAPPLPLPMLLFFVLALALLTFLSPEQDLERPLSRFRS